MKFLAKLDFRAEKEVRRMDIIKKNFELIQEGRNMTPSTVTPKNMKAATAEALQASNPNPLVYVELSDQPVVELDALSQMRANLNHLEDLYNRFGFMMREVSYLTRK